MRKVTFIALMLSAVMPLSAQYRVKGLVTDSAGEGEPYATIRIYGQADSSKVVKALATDANGKFDQELANEGKYHLSVSSVGKNTVKKTFGVSKTATVADLGSIVMGTNATTLKGVEVIAQKPLVKTEIDRLSYDVQSDEDSKTNTALEMLRKVPMVTVDGQDNIKVKGSSNFKIYKNGRPDNTLSGNAKDVLKAIPANMIKRIEVITEPGAKYDAEGVNGILNIVMMDNTVISGVMGSLNASMTDSGAGNANAYLMTQVGKFTTSLNYGYNRMSRSQTRSNSAEEVNYVQGGNKMIKSNQSENPGYVHYGNIDASYEMDSLNLMTFSFGGYFYKLHVNSIGNSVMNDAAGNAIYSYTGLFNSPKYQYFDFNGKFDYQHLTHHKGESLIFSYLLSTTNQTHDTEEEYSNMVNFPLPYDSFISNSRLRFYEHTFQFDWTRPIAEKHKVELGAKYIYRLNNSNTEQYYSNDVTQLTDFRHLTQVAAAYGEYAFNTTKWGARAGVRYEYSHLAAKYKDGSNPDFHKNLGDVVPTLSVSYKINDQNNLKLNFATRINRPGIAYLNPAVSKTPTEVSSGNPDLASSRNNSLSLAYTLMKPKITMNASANYSFTNNGITQWTYVDAADGLIYNNYRNIGKSNNASVSAYVQWQITPKTSLMFNGSGFYSKMSNESLGLSQDRWWMYFFAQGTQKLPWRLTLTVSGGRNDSGLSDLYSHGAASYFHFATLRRAFLKDDRLTVTFNAFNPFQKNWNWKSYTVNGDTRGWSNSSSKARQFSIAVSYRFGKLNTQVKKTAKTIENNDLSGRK